jgi:hypothetical protein
MSIDATFQRIINTNDFHVHRKPLILNLQKILGAKVITYIASAQHPASFIMSQDIPLFEDLLLSISGSEEGYLIINSNGGDGNVAEKIITMCRQRFTKSFKVIVPNFAKSAATMIALGSDEVLMGYLAELGPIDPQLGNPLGGVIPARSIIDGLNLIRANIAQGDPVQMYFPMLAQIRPEILAQCNSAIEGSREFAEKWLRECMLKDNPKQAVEVAKTLSQGVKYKSHGKVIDYNEAHDVLKLNVKKIPFDSDLWNNVWELYCRSILFLQQQGASAKLFESESVSLAMQIRIEVMNKPQQMPQLLGQPIEAIFPLKPKQPINPEKPSDAAKTLPPTPPVPETSDSPKKGD